MSGVITSSVSKDGVTDGEIRKVTDSLSRAFPVEVTSQGRFIQVGPKGGKQWIIKHIDGTLSFVARQEDGIEALWVAAAIAGALGAEIVDASGQAMKSNAQTVRAIWGADLSAEERIPGEKLGFVLPRVVSAIAIKF